MTSTTDTSTTPSTENVATGGHLGMSRGTRRAAAAVATLIGAGAIATAAAPTASASTVAPDGTTQPKVWDKVADCESGGDWKIDTGNGFHGGVQFDSGTWARYGGHKYGRQANDASRREQIVVAKRVLAKQGPGAWPVCSQQAGLTKHNGGATSSDLPPSDEALQKQADAKKANAKKSTSTHKSTTTAKTTTAKATTAKATTAKATPHKPKHSAAGRKTYTVKGGDTLSAIAKKLNVKGGWHALYSANRATVHNADVLRVGQRLLLPKA